LLFVTGSLEGVHVSKGRVLAAMSGGVDSSVSAALLRDAGYEVVGAMMRFWPDQKRVSTFDSCCSPDAAYEARRVADHLGLPFYLLDYRDVFEENIIQPFVNEYREGRTPNPCVLCNSKVKFDHLVKKARMLGCDFVATGHYVRRVNTERGPEFHRGSDPKKDQTYFLWGTPRDALERVLFPVGHMEKPAVRELARGYGLITAEKPESQDICFVPSTIQNYLSERIAPRHGEIVDLSGKVVGEHEGTQFYTLGQKKGLKLFQSHLERFVVRIDAATNRVVVGVKDDCFTSRLEAVDANLLVNLESLPEIVSAQVRYRTAPVQARVTRADAHSFALELLEPQFAVTPGQSVVLYDGSRLLGGGFIRTEATMVAALRPVSSVAVSGD
jgi:tRNA-uridine 2-sulfurtransferase